MALTELIRSDRKIYPARSSVFQKETFGNVLITVPINPYVGQNNPSLYDHVSEF